MDKNYSKREIDSKFDGLQFQIKDLREDMGDYFEASTGVQKEILGKVTLTNGSVAAINVKQARSDGFMKGIAVAASAGFLLLTGTMGWLIPQFVNLKAQVVSTAAIHTAVTQAVSDSLSSFVINK